MGVFAESLLALQLAPEEGDKCRHMIPTSVIYPPESLDLTRTGHKQGFYARLYGINNSWPIFASLIILKQWRRYAARGLG